MIHCAFENGNNASLRHVTTGCIVIDADKAVLLVKRAPHILNGNKFTIPGGFLDRDENFEQGALRELSEETGLQGKNPTLFFINGNPKRPKEDRQNVDIVFVVREFEGALKDNSEVTEMKWFAKDAIPDDGDFAFDHRESIMKYFQYLEKPFALPLIA